MAPTAPWPRQRVETGPAKTFGPGIRPRRPAESAPANGPQMRNHPACRREGNWYNDGVSSARLCGVCSPAEEVDHGPHRPIRRPATRRFGRIKDQYWDGYNSTSDVDRFKHAYDYAGNRIYRDIDRAIYATNNKDQAYSYDGLNRLKTFNEGTLSGTTITGFNKGDITFFGSFSRHCPCAPRESAGLRLHGPGALQSPDAPRHAASTELAAAANRNASPVRLVEKVECPLCLPANYVTLIGGKSQ